MKKFHFDPSLVAKISKVEKIAQPYHGFRKECLDLRHCTLASGETLLILRLPEKSYSEPPVVVLRGMVWQWLW